MILSIVAFLFSVISLVLLLVSNLGTTFNSTFLPSIYLVQLNEAVTGRHIRYGVYNSCMYFGDVSHSCTVAHPAYSFDRNQFAEFCGADMTNASMVSIYTDVIADANLGTFQGIVLIMPSVILVFLALVCSIALYKSRNNHIVSFLGILTALTGFLTGAAGLALTIATFWKGMNYLEGRVEGLSHQWGPAIYLVGIGSGCMLITLISFFMSLFSPDNDTYHKRDTYLYDYDLNNNASQQYDHSATIPLTSKGDNYGYANAISSPPKENYYQPSTPTSNSYPSYHQGNYGNNTYNSNYY